MRIRRMLPQDVDAVAEIEKDIFSQPWSRQGFLESLAGTDTLFLVADEGHCGDMTPEILGYVGMYQALDEGEITNVAVSKPHRQKGIGRALIAELIAESTVRGISRIVLEVRVSNSAAIALYEQMGFSRIGVRKGFYDFPKEDADIMEWRTPG